MGVQHLQVVCSSPRYKMGKISLKNVFGQKMRDAHLKVLFSKLVLTVRASHNMQIHNFLKV